MDGYSQPQSYQPQPPAGNQGSWYMRIPTKIVGTIAGVGSIVLGVIAAISIYPTCIIAGILQIIVGFLVTTFEAPFLCGFLHFLSRIADFWEGRSQWYKAAFYLVLGIIPSILCLGFSIGLASAGVIITAVLYAFVAMGKRGTGAANGSAPLQDSGYVDKSGLVESQMYNQNART